MKFISPEIPAKMLTFNGLSTFGIASYATFLGNIALCRIFTPRFKHTFSSYE